VALTSAQLAPIKEGLGLVPGSLWLIGLRAALVVVAALPALLVALVGVAAGPARQPYFTEVQGPLPILHLVRLSRELPPAVVGAALLAAVVTLLLQQILTAGALGWLDPGRRERPEGSTPGAVLRQGTPWIWAMLRVVLLAGLLAAGGLGALGWLHERLALYGEVEGWSGRTLWMLLPALRGGLSLGWLSLVGAWAFWCRVLMIADGRHTARTAGALVLRVWWRHPVRAPLFYVALVLLTLAGSAAMLAAWRQAPPEDLFGAVLRGGSWLLLLLLKAVAWHWLLRAGRLLYAGPSLDDVRQRPDGPLGVGRLLKRIWSRFRRRKV
jgi:hypothetical protein